MATVHYQMRMNVTGIAKDFVKVAFVCCHPEHFKTLNRGVITGGGGENKQEQQKYDSSLLIKRMVTTREGSAAKVPTTYT